MAGWKDVLATMTLDLALERARSMVAQGTVYKLGRGGFRPDRALWSEGRTSDCSGFVAWALGCPREFPPGSGHWLQTTTYWEGGGYPQALFVERSMAEAMPGDLLVFPDHAGRQGHIGIVTVCENQQPSRVVHCAAGNFRQTHDAIRETSPEVLLGNPRVRAMRISFDELRSVAGIAAPPLEEAVPSPNAHLRSMTLAGDRTLRLVASGMLVLEPSGEPTGGIAALCRGLSRVSDGLASSNRRPACKWNDGIANEPVAFDVQTVEALKAFQRRVSLEPTGELDAATLHALDAVLLGRVEPAFNSSRDLPEVRVAPTSVEVAAPPPIVFTLRQEGHRFFAHTGDQPEFFIGRQVAFQRLIGLTNTSQPGIAYAAKDHVAEFGHWANLIEPTAIAEASGFFHCHNTYDRARFTFGFLQFAAHNPDSDFVLMLRGLLNLPLAAAYFQDLSLVDGRVSGPVNGEIMTLETADSTTLLMDYLNPSSQNVDQREALNCAKFVHWSASDPLHRALQVKFGIQKARKDTKTNHKRYDLDRRSDVTCALIFDIHHQGRASVNKVRAALESATTEEGAWEELLAIGLPSFKGRIAALRKHIAALIATGVLGRRSYSAEKNEFV